MGARAGPGVQLGPGAGGVSAVSEVAAEVVDLATTSRRDLNARLHALGSEHAPNDWRVVHPGGRHSIAVGVDAPVEIVIDGHVGYYCAGMNQQATVRIRGNCGVGVAENMMSGTVVVEGNASQSAAATGRGGTLIIEGDASARCGISMKGVDIVVRGSIGHMGAFMAQKGCLVVCGDAGDALGDSIYEARLYVRGQVESLGADCVEKEMRNEHLSQLRELLERSGMGDVEASEFRRYGSARQLYNFKVDDA